MKMMKIVSFGFVLSCLVFFTPANAAVTIEPDNIVMPASAGGIFRCDLIINDPDGVTNADSFQSTINVSGPGTLTFDVDTTQLVGNETNYWIYGENEGVLAANATGVNNYLFSDLFSISATPPETLYAGDIMARYAFAWDGTVGDYTFTIDLSSAKSFVGLEDWTKVALEFTPGSFSGTNDSFTVAIPEPATVMLLGLGGAALLKNRKRKA